MIDFKGSKKRRFNNALFNPYKNGITSYDVAYLSSKKSFYKIKSVHILNDPKKEYNAA